ncbi:TadA family conjugal transfer-associated ATPase [Sporichthya polymorpha]|uniref:TadA family conjugal transfer-associated ATPase n=1 Tax=Sporichthya polymorpha TaxID=35751 RepID=UPI000382D33A|nr:TadA family conjugal transfer-associated ATPase [Sporichthya polymorpha]
MNAPAGALEPLLAEPGVTDVLVNGPQEVWVDRGAGLVRVAVDLGDEAALRRLAQRLVAAAGRRLDDSCPFADAVLPDGTRLHAVLAPVAVRGTALSLRVPRRSRFTLADLVAAGTIPADGMRWLRALVEARLAILVSGGAGTGKTTLLATLLGLVAPDERIVLVEDTRELDPDHAHVVRLEARPPNVEGAGAIGLRELVRQALRMRPDRLVVGEVRGGEVIDLLAALNTGHRGGGGTVHANEAAAVPARLEALAAAAGMRRDALHAQLAAGIDAVVHLEREEDGRRVTGIAVPRRGPDGLVRLVRAVGFRRGRRGGEVVVGPAYPQLGALLEARSIPVPEPR